MKAKVSIYISPRIWVEKEITIPSDCVSIELASEWLYDHFRDKTLNHPNRTINYIPIMFRVNKLIDYD